jgi:hypothetical protein
MEITNGISCFKMKGCYLLNEPWWIKGLLSFALPFFGSKKLKKRIYKRAKQYQLVSTEVGHSNTTEGEEGEEEKDNENEWSKRFPLSFCGVGSNKDGDCWLNIGTAAIDNNNIIDSITSLRDGSHRKKQSEKRLIMKRKTMQEQHRRNTFMVS